MGFTKCLKDRRRGYIYFELNCVRHCLEECKQGMCILSISTDSNRMEARRCVNQVELNMAEGKSLEIALGNLLSFIGLVTGL